LEHHKNSFKRINSTKTINILNNNIACMGIRTNKLQQIVSYLEENNFDILLAQEANVDFKHKTKRIYILKETLKRNITSRFLKRHSVQPPLPSHEERLSPLTHQ
jgi:hypothetical protein